MSQQLYRRLNSEKILSTSEKLHQRVEERFPQWGLSQVCAELDTVTREAKANIEEINRPNYYLRAGIVAMLILVVALGVNAWASIDMSSPAFTLTDVLQLLESGIQDLVFFGAGIYFLISIENRTRRNHTLDKLNELRSLAHVIDMHQLTKDPERTLNPKFDTESSPRTQMTIFELSRYLDYCSEMLSVIGKVAALYVQDFDDQVALTAVNEIETLASGLSHKIWQKIMIIHQLDENMHGGG